MIERAALLALFPLLFGACAAIPQKEAAPSGLYLKVYAMQFVEAMRGSSIEAGAFEISKEPEEDALYHLGIDVMLAGKSERLVVKLRADAGGLKPVHATIGSSSVYPDPAEEWKNFDAWHADADRRAAQE